MASSPNAIGFYTVQHCERVGWTGGYLVLNAAGRPLEFHCTLPVRPTRTHEILYGPTLRDHVIGEAIGAALLPRARNRPLVICCDQPEAMHLEAHHPTSIALVTEAAESEEGPIANDSLVDHQPLKIAGVTCLVPAGRFAELQASVGPLEDFPDLLEPFGRIREAIQEAQTQVAARAA